MQVDEPLPVVADLGIRRKLPFYRWIRLLTVRRGEQAEEALKQTE